MKTSYAKLFQAIRNHSYDEAAEELRVVREICPPIILPSKMTMLHVFAERTNPIMLEKALELDFPYNLDRNKKTPLSYALQKKHYACIDCIVKHFIEYPKKIFLTASELL